MKTFLLCLIVICLLGLPALSYAKAGTAKAAKPAAPAKFDLFGSFTGSEGSRNLISVVIMLTILSFAPAILLLMSSFTRIVIVLSFLRQAIGVPQLPPNQIVIGLSLFLTFFVMAPTYEKIHAEALSPFMNNSIGYEEFLSRSSQVMSGFMLKYTKEKDLALFTNIAGLGRPANEKEIPFRVVVPAFAISELKRAFQIGFLLYIPFLVIDMVIASVLLSAGMMMLPPIFISLPFKLMLFVLVDGWNLLTGSIIKGFF
ncbi:MAG: Flagellar biosynthetic protein FliP precursor [Syntrophorhabdaceae bacterium PtaU1.Bin034]|jgi:flagellar biosynthetic protein FliP|nr:MAG: Flagellar biosynthetic protein FliP precursor [Syntrophorhabdaceae bacterium PtaU1.Bin034]